MVLCVRWKNLKKLTLYVPLKNNSGKKIFRAGGKVFIKIEKYFMFGRNLGRRL